MYVRVVDRTAETADATHVLQRFINSGRKLGTQGGRERRTRTRSDVVFFGPRLAAAELLMVLVRVCIPGIAVVAASWPWHA